MFLSTIPPGRFFLKVKHRLMDNTFQRPSAKRGFLKKRGKGPTHFFVSLMERTSRAAHFYFIKSVLRSETSKNRQDEFTFSFQ